MAVEALAGQREARGEARLRQPLVPAVHAALAVLDVGVAQHLVHGVAQRHVFLRELAVLGRGHPVGVAQREVVRVGLLLVAALEPVGKERRGVGGDLAAEEVQREREPQVEIALDHVEREAALRSHVLVGVGLHQLRRARHDALHARLAHEHVVGLLGEHEARGAAERIEPALGQGEELVLAVAVREHREHEEVQPVVHGLVEGPQDARLVRVAAAPLEQLLRLLAAVAAELAVQEVHHGPQVPALLHVHLEEVPHVVEAGRGVAEHALLLDRCRLGVALRHDQPAQRVAVLAGHLLPDRLAHVVAEADGAVGLRVGQEDAPAVVRHLHVVEMGPALRVHADGRAQPHVGGLEATRAHVHPPLDVVGLPLLQRAQQALVLIQVHVVGDLCGEVDVRHVRSPGLEGHVELGGARSAATSEGGFRGGRSHTPRWWPQREHPSRMTCECPP